MRQQLRHSSTMFSKPAQAKRSFWASVSWSMKAIVNAMLALLATGGSTNHLIHWVAVARAAGIVIDWDDFDALSAITPLLARVYPNGYDVNAMQAAGGPLYTSSTTRCWTSICEVLTATGETMAERLQAVHCKAPTNRSFAVIAILSMHKEGGCTSAAG
jgi:dihydroxyacid dehydratase/phosphogluconate dehydratase